MAPPRNQDDHPDLLPSLGKEIVVHRDKLKEIYKRLQADCDLYTNNGTGLGTQHDFEAYAPVYKDSLGHYPAADGLYMTCSNAYNNIGSTYKEFLTAYQGVIDAIKQTAENYNKAEDANTHGKSGASGQPTNRGSNYYA